MTWRHILEDSVKTARLEAARLEEARRDAAESLIELGNVTTEMQESENDKAIQTEQCFSDASTQIELSAENLDKIEEENRSLKIENAALLKKVQSNEFTEESLSLVYWSILWSPYDRFQICFFRN